MGALDLLEPSELGSCSSPLITTIRLLDCRCSGQPREHRCFVRRDARESFSVAHAGGAKGITLSSTGGVQAFGFPGLWMKSRL